MTRTLRLGTRGSQLARWQATAVADLLRKRSGIAPDLVIIRTSGDEPGTGRGPGGATAPLPTHLPPASDGSVKRLFVKEIEEALLTGAIDLAVHSAKDMPAGQPEGLAIAGVLAREDPRDAIVLPSGTPPPTGFAELSVRLGPTPSIGTSSVRRAAQLARALPGARFTPLRGNLDTRLRRLDEGQCDAAVLAAAGLRRLGFAGRVSWLVPFEICLPSPGQGIVAIEVRADDVEVRRLVAAITDAPAARALEAERAVVTTLGGGCQMPLGAIALPDGDTLHLQGVVLSADGREIVRAEARGSIRVPAAAGQRLARALLDHGAGPLLERARDARQTGPR